MTKKRRLPTAPTTQRQTTRSSALTSRTLGATRIVVARASSKMSNAVAMTSMDNERTSSSNNKNNDSIRFSNIDMMRCNAGDNKLSSSGGDDQRRSENANSKSLSCVNCASAMLTISNENIGRRHASCLPATANKLAPCGKYQRSAVQLCEGDAPPTTTTESLQVQRSGTDSSSEIYNYNNNMKHSHATHFALQHKCNSERQQAGGQLQAECGIQQQQSEWRQTPTTYATASAKTKFEATSSAVDTSQCQIARKAAKTTTTKIKASCKPVSVKLTTSTKANISSAANTEITRKPLETVFVCPSIVTANAGAKLASAKPLTTTKTSAILTNTYTPAALPTTTRAAGTLMRQALVTIEDFVCCRSSKYATNSVMNNNNNNCSSIANGFVWLLPVLCLLAAFGCGQAGFACLSNPCVFGVCIDGLNR